MGLVYADVDLINYEDVLMARRHLVAEDEIRRISINILADTGSCLLCINENIQENLQLPFLETRVMQLANSQTGEYNIVSNAELRFKNRTVVCSAVVLPGDSEPLLGVIQLEEMHVLIRPTSNELIVNPDHPYYAVLKLK